MNYVENRQKQGSGAWLYQGTSERISATIMTYTVSIYARILANRIDQTGQIVLALGKIIETRKTTAWPRLTNVAQTSGMPRHL